MSNQIQENIFQSIDYIVEARMSQLAYDKTELCTVEKVYGDERPNTYYVSNGSLKFDAKPLDDKKYTKDSKVYVTIPQGDYTLEKIIVGSYSSETPYKAQYVTPESQIIAAQVLGPEADEEEGLCTIIAGTKQYDNSMLFETIGFPHSGFGEYNKMLLQFTIGSNLSIYQGTYTIHLKCYTEPNLQGTGYLFSIPSSELYGNPYQFNTDFPVSYLLSIPQYAKDINTEELVDFNIHNIKSIEMALEGEGFAVADAGATITIYSVALSVGYDAKEFGENSTQVKLILDSPNTSQDSDYEYALGSNKVLSFDFGIVQNDILSIYNETNSPSKLAQYSAYWCQYIKGYQKQENSNDIGEKDISESGTYWKTIASDPLTETDIYTYTHKPNSEWDEDQIKVVIRYEGELEEGQSRPYYISNGLTFKNKELKPPQGTNSAVDNDLELSLASGDDGNYNIYGTDNRLISYVKKNQKTSVVISKYFDNTAWSGEEQVTWKMPIHATMLKANDSWKKLIDKTDEDGNIVYEKDDTGNNKLDEDGNSIPIKIYDELEVSEDGQYYIIQGKGLREITYSFSEIYSSSCVHNAIYCEVYREDKNKTYRGFINLTFGLANTNGSNYALNIVPEHYGGLPVNGTIQYTAVLTDIDNKEMTIDPAKLEWSWYYPDSYKRESVENADGTTTIQTIDLMARGGFTLTHIFDSKTEKPTTQCSVSRIETDISWGNMTYARSRAILKATLKQWQNDNGLIFNLEAYYPIGLLGWKNDLDQNKPQNYYITGAARIMYQYNGALGSYDKNPYLLYARTDDGVVEKGSQQWSIVDENGRTINLNGVVQSGDKISPQEYPTLKPIKENNKLIGCIISPLPQIITKVKPFYIWISPDAPGTDGATNHWIQPVLITQDTYASDLVNNWNGELSIDTEGNKILAQSIGAGVKDTTDNTYTGVLMGKVVLNEGKSNEITDYGLYGFQNGKLRFKFDEQGRAFIGNEASYIKFDPTLNGASNQLEIAITKGQIAGWVVDQYSLTNTVKDTNNNITSIFGMQVPHGNTKIALSIGGTNPNSWAADAPFYVTHQGQVNVRGGKMRFITDILLSSGNTQQKYTTFGSVTDNAQTQYVGVFWANGEITNIETGLSGVLSQDNTMLFLGEKYVILRAKGGDGGITLYGECSETQRNVLTGDYWTVTGDQIVQGNQIINKQLTIEQELEVKGSGQFFSTWDTDYYIRVNDIDDYWTNICFYNNDSKANYCGMGVSQYNETTKEQYLDIIAKNGEVSIQSYSGIKKNNEYYPQFYVIKDGGALQGTWKLNGAAISTSSDKNLKYAFKSFNFNYDQLFDYLQPQLYKLKDGTSGRFHSGFIAQEVNDALFISGLDTMDFAAITIDHPGEDNESWALRYEEFIALNTWQIQKLKTRVTELETLLREKGVI